MADSAEIVRLMQHAATRLEEEDPFAILPENYRNYSDKRECLERANSVSVAVTYAAAILRTVAAVMTDEPPSGGDPDA